MRLQPIPDGQELATNGRLQRFQELEYLRGAYRPGEQPECGPAADTTGISRSNAKIHGSNDGGRQRLGPERGPRPAISPPRIATRLDRFRCGHLAAYTAYPQEVTVSIAQFWKPVT